MKNIENSEDKLQKKFEETLDRTAIKPLSITISALLCLLIYLIFFTTLDKTGKLITGLILVGLSAYLFSIVLKLKQQNQKSLQEYMQYKSTKKNQNR